MTRKPSLLLALVALALVGCNEDGIAKGFAKVKPDKEAPVHKVPDTSSTITIAALALAAGLVTRATLFRSLKDRHGR
jgi:hypothetical protein